MPDVNGAFYLNLNTNLTPGQEAALKDERLISGLQVGDEKAYERLIERFQTPVYNLAWRLVNDPGRRERRGAGSLSESFSQHGQFSPRLQIADLDLSDRGE